MTKIIPQFLIAAPCSGSGKTTVSRGLMAAFKRRGMSVQPYKCGPDYIDTKYHTAVCGRSSVNLDTFMSSQEHVRNIYYQYASDAEVCVVEGMMGLFDGYERDRGSSSEVASVLGLPVLLVVDAHSVAYSIAALLTGFRDFRSGTHIAGVVFNKVGSERHYEMLKKTCEDTGIPCFGYLPKDKSLEQKSRYLGLDFSKSENLYSIDTLIEQIEKHIDIPVLLKTMERPLEEYNCHVEGNAKKLNIVVLRNEESFSFLYTEHLDILSRLGQVTYLNPEEDNPLPENTDLLYLPGGYPERHAVCLSEARRCLSSIRNYIERGGYALAECGGMIYLSQGIYSDENEHPVSLCGVLPFSISCQAEYRKLSLGYRQFQYNGQELRGHEFHYSQFYNDEHLLCPSVSQVYDACHRPVPTPVFRYKNLIASYTHLYWGEINILQLFDKTENK